MLRHTITGLVIDYVEAITEHCQFSFLSFYAIIHSVSFIVNPHIKNRKVVLDLPVFFLLLSHNQRQNRLDID